MCKQMHFFAFLHLKLQYSFILNIGHVMLIIFIITINCIELFQHVCLFFCLRLFQDNVSHTCFSVMIFVEHFIVPHLL